MKRAGVGWSRAAVLAASLLTMSTGAIGCGWLVEEIAEQAYIANKVRDYEFAADVDATWKETKIALEEEGFKVEDPALVLDETIVCPGVENAFDKQRAHVRITKTGLLSHKLEVDVIREEKRDGKWQPAGTQQGTDVMWKVISRRDPDFAKEVEEKAEKKGEKGRDIANQIDDLLSED